MSKPSLTLSVSPTSGYSILSVTASYSDVVIDSYIDPVSIAHIGYLQENTIADGFHIAHLGYYISDPEYSTYWDFGDGETGFGESVTHDYEYPGHYVLKLVLTIYENTYYYPIDINVLSLPYITDPENSIGNLSDGDRYCLHFGSSEKEGFGWSIFGNDSWLWADTSGCIFEFFQQEDQMCVIYDSVSGLPYVLDVRKDNGFLNEVYDDKVDPLIEDSGTYIDSTFTTEELSGSSEQFMIRPSDLSVFMQGVNKESLYSDFESDLTLIVDGTDISKIYDITFDRELFFKDGKNKEGHIHQLKFYQNRSGYILTSIRYSLIVYDKALYPHISTTTIETAQENFSNLIAWATRYDYTVDRVDHYNIFDTSYFATGPDGYSNSAIQVDTDDWEDYEIIVTNFFTEDETTHIVFINSVGSNPYSNMTIRNFEIIVDDISSGYIDFDGVVTSWGTSDTGTATTDNYEMLLTGNAYKKIAYPVDCNGPVVKIKFEFKSSTEGSLHCVGLSDDVLDDSYPSTRVFQLYGTDYFGYPNYNNYVQPFKELNLMSKWYYLPIDFYMWSTNSHVFHNEINEIIYTFAIDSETWHLIKISDVQSPDNVNVYNGKYFDFRIVLKNQISTQDLLYYYEDIENNNGDMFCP